MIAPFQALSAQHYELLRPATADEIIAFAGTLLEQRLQRGPVLGGAEQVQAFLRTRLGGAARELFGVLFVDSRHQYLGFEILFMGSLRGSEVHPREVVRRALALNAAAVILVHNHPSGYLEPSPEDILLTRRIDDALALLDMRVLDHLIVSASDWVSLSARGWRFSDD